MHTCHSTTCGNSFFLSILWVLRNWQFIRLDSNVPLPAGPPLSNFKDLHFPRKELPSCEQLECPAVAAVTAVRPRAFFCHCPNISQVSHSRCPVFSSLHRQVLFSGCSIRVVIWIQVIAFHYSHILTVETCRVLLLPVLVGWLLWITVFWASVCCPVDKFFCSLECFFRSGMARTKFPWC